MDAQWNFASLKALLVDTFCKRGDHADNNSHHSAILILIGALPRWGYSSSWGYGPGGIVGVILIIVIILALTGRV